MVFYCETVGDRCIVIFSGKWDGLSFSWEVEVLGVWYVLDGEKDQEQYFSFLDIEGILTGDRIPFLDGTTKRLPRDYLNE